MPPAFNCMLYSGIEYKCLWIRKNCDMKLSCTNLLFHSFYRVKSKQASCERKHLSIMLDVISTHSDSPNWTDGFSTFQRQLQILYSSSLKLYKYIVSKMSKFVVFGLLIIIIQHMYTIIYDTWILQSRKSW